MSIHEDFKIWWHDEGSGMPPRKGEETCDHVKRVSEIAWHNGAYKANDALIDENARLKAEVERLKAVSTIEQRTIQGLQQTPEWSEIARLTAECRRLEAENSRLRASSFVTAVPVEQYENLKAEVEQLTRKIEVADNHAQCLEMVINAGTANELRLKAEVERLEHQVRYWRIEAEVDNARWLRCLEDLEKLRKDSQP